jgi:hypothetical protein
MTLVSIFMNAKIARFYSNLSMVIVVCFAHTAIRRAPLFNWINRVAEFMTKGSRLIKAGGIRSAITALCCFTLVLDWLFAIPGMSVLVGYPDYERRGSSLVFYHFASRACSM